MVKANYDAIETDYIDLEFVCKKCGHKLKTGHIKLPDCGEKGELIFKCTNPECTFLYNINMVDYITHGEIIIKILPDETILSIKPYTYENVANVDVSILDYITNSVVFNKTLNEIEILGEDTKQELHRMLLVLLVSSMDYYFGYFIKRKILTSQEYRSKYIEYKCSKKKHFKKFNIKELLRTESFQNQKKIQEILANIFNIDIQINKKLELAVCKRNNIIHNNRRENNGNDICISKTELLSLKKEIDNFLHKIREHFVSQNIDKLLSR